MISISKLRIAYMGTPDFAVAPLKALIEAGVNIVAVVTVADKPAGRGLQLKESPVKKFAVENGLTVLQPLKLKDDQFVIQMRDLNIDLGIVVAFRMLPEVIWSMPKLGTFNLHGSLLPMYRGAAPINWAIINGDTKTGVTTFFLDHEIDCGEIIDTIEVEILSTDNVGSLHDKLMAVGAKLVVDTVKKIASGDYFTKAQISFCDRTRAIAPKIFKQDCKINWSQNVVNVYNFIRGLAPFPGAWTEYKGVTYKLFDIFYLEGKHQDEFGDFINDGNKFIKIPCDRGWIFVKSLQPAGNKCMTSAEFLRGHATKL